MERKVEFYSDGLRLAGLVWTPDGLAPGERRPAVVLCHGFTSTKERFLPVIGGRLVQAGYVVLGFDYRGFGESEGPRWRLIPTEQVRDIRSAITYVQHLECVDPSRIGLYGTSWGGATSVATTAADQRVCCTVAVVGVANGERWLRSLRRAWEWQAFLDRLAKDRLNRVLTGKSEWVNRYEVMVPDPLTEAQHRELAKKVPDVECELPLESAEAVIEFNPEQMVETMVPRPLLFIAAERDVLVPIEEARGIYRRAPEPKRLVIVPGASHYDVYYPPAFDGVLDEAVCWFDTYLKG